MDQENMNLENNNPLEICKESYGFGDKQCYWQYQHGEQQIGLQAKDNLPKLSYDGLKRTIAEKKIKSYLEMQQEKKRVVKLKNIWKPLLAVSLVGTLLLGMGTTVMGKRNYAYKVREVDGSKQIQLSHDDNIIDENDE